MEKTSSPKTVVVINQYAKPLTEPGGTRHVELFGRMRGWRHLIIAGDRDLYSQQKFTAEDPHFKVIPVSNYKDNDHRRVFSWITYSVGALTLALRQKRPSVIYASSPHILAPVAGWIAAKLKRAKFVLEIRDLWPQCMVDTGNLKAESVTHRALRALERWLYMRADRIVIVTKAWQSHIERMGIDPHKVGWVSNSAEPSDFALRSDVYKPLRARIPVKGKLFIYAGAHGPANGLDELLNSAIDLPSHTFVLLGNGMEKPRLQERVQSENISNVHFLDMVPKQELAGILGEADVGVHVLANVAVFQLGVSPNKLYDYMAAGLAVVTNCLGEPTDVVEESGAGIAVDPLNLATAIRKMAEAETGELRRMGALGREYIQSNRSRTVMAARLQSVLDDVVSCNK